MTEGRFPRRTFLRGVGTMMSLPLLEAMLPLSALAQSVKKRPNRLAFMMVPNGVNMDAWTPKAQGTAFELPYTMEPLAKVRGSVMILSGLTQNNAEALGDGPGDHARSAATWLTGVHCLKTSGADIHNGISIDQLAAQHIGNQTRFASLELGCERGAVGGDCDSGYSCAYSSCISWQSPTTPVAKEINPRLVFERLFGNGDESGETESKKKRELFKQSVLDFVMEDAAKLKAQLGKRDQHKLDEYLEGVREIEARLTRLESAGALSAMAGVKKPGGPPADFGEHIRIMGDMMVLAFQADLTRTSTFMFANEGSNRSYVEAGVAEGHHDVSHHGGKADKLEKKRQIDRFHMQQVAHVLEKMQSIDEIDGTLLDNSMVVYGAGISDGNRHNHDDLPILLAGKGGGTLHTGRHIAYTDGTPLNNLYLSLLDRIGIPADKLGDSTGKLQQLF